MSAAPPYRAPTLLGVGRLLHGFSAALRTPADHARFAAEAGLGTLRVQRLRQVHGAQVVRAEDVARGVEPPCGDALVARSEGLAIAIATADCVPVLLADHEAGVVGAVHAGWRGTRSRVILRAVEAMVALGARPERTRAGIGPSVQGGCYEVGPEVREEFERCFPDSGSLFSGRRLDLVRAARAELDRCGIPPGAVSAIDLCTHCRPELASHRREGQARGTNLAVIAIAGGD